MVTEHPRALVGPLFTVPDDIVDGAAARKIIIDAAAKWCPATARESSAVRGHLAREFPDDGLPENFWHEASSKRFLASIVKRGATALPETAGFSRPGSWLEGEN